MHNYLKLNEADQLHTARKRQTMSMKYREVKILSDKGEEEA